MFLHIVLFVEIIFLWAVTVCVCVCACVCVCVSLPLSALRWTTEATSGGFTSSLALTDTHTHKQKTALCHTGGFYFESVALKKLSCDTAVEAGGGITSCSYFLM